MKAYNVNTTMSVRWSVQCSIVISYYSPAHYNIFFITLCSLYLVSPSPSPPHQSLQLELEGLKRDSTSQQQASGEERRALSSKLQKLTKDLQVGGGGGYRVQDAA